MCLVDEVKITSDSSGEAVKKKQKEIKDITERKVNDKTDQGVTM